MKFVRPLLIILGVIMGLVALGVAVALVPAVQRWAVLRATRSTPGLKLDVAAVSAGFSGLALEGLQLEKNGLTVKLGRLEADYSLSQVLFSRRLTISRLAASGLMVDASRLSRAKVEAVATGAPAAAPGLLAQLRLPVELVLEDCRLEGRALLPGTAAGKPPIEADYRITGGKFAPGREGTLLLVATLKNPVAEARVATLHAQGSLSATETGQKTFSRVSVKGVIDAEGRIFSEQNQLKVSAELAKEAAGESYIVSVDTLMHGAAENVLAVHALLPAGGQEYAGDWTLTARTAQLEPFFLGAALPDFNAQGAGHFTFNPATAGASLQGTLAADASRLEVLEPALRAIGPVNLQAQFDIAAAGGIARLHQLEVRLAGAQPVLALQAARAAEFNLRERRLQVGGSTPGEALNLKLHGVPLAWLRPFIHAADVSGGMITGEFTVTGETDHLLFRAVQPLHVEQLTVVQRGELRLAKADVSLTMEAALAGRELKATISAFTLKTAAGDSLAARADVSLPLTPQPAIVVSASYTADLPTLLAPWLPLGRVKAAGGTDFTLAQGKIQLRRLIATVTDAAGLTLFQATALRPFNFDPATRRAVAEGDGSGELLHFTLGRVPLDVLPLTQPGAVLGGMVEQGEFGLTVDRDKLVLRATAPLKLGGVSLAEEGRAALAGLAVEAQPVLELTGGGLKIQSGEVTIRTARGDPLMTCKGETMQSKEAGLRGTLTFTLEVPALGTQPLFAEAEAVSQGRASGEIRLALGPASQVEGRFTINGLVTTVVGRTLPVANLSFRAVAAENGRFSVQAPLLLDRAGQRSDLNFSLELTPAGRAFGLDGRLTGTHVELDDALSLLGVFLVSAAEPRKPAEPAAAPLKVTADPAPAWARFNGQLLLDIKSITHGSEWSMTGLNGLLVLEPARVTLQKLEATFGEKGRLTAQGGITFTAGAQPYSLTGDFSVTEFDAGRLFKALEPAKPPTIEGIFSVTGRLAGTGETLDRTLDRTRGRFELSSRQGVFRGLQRTSNKLSMASKAVELGASVFGSIFGSEKVTKAAEKVAGQAYFLDQLAQSIGEFNYDQLNVRLTRDESLDVTLEDVSLVSPEIRLTGKGTVTYQPDVPLLQQPLNASLLFTGRGKTEQLLGKLRLLDGTRDELGYARTREPVTLGGTLAKPDPSAFFTRIATAKLSELVAPEN